MNAALPLLDHRLVSSPELAAAAGRSVDLPRPELLELPERAVQFGTGALLRGLVDYVVDEANRRGCFNGRIVAVSSTASGRDRRINEQDGLFTLVTRGLENGSAREARRVVASVSRALSAATEWEQVLALARSPQLDVLFSNTTEVGIVLDKGDVDPGAAPPRSFPGKLTRLLYERACEFAFAWSKGIVVVPCELIENNGDRLREVVLATAERWGLGGAFLRWIEEAVPFCNTLVDRIVPGAPPREEAERLYEELGYRDDLLTTCEGYRLFAIQGDDALRERLGFATGGDPGVVVARDISPYRERKVRVLNGAHTITTPVALLCGLETVRDVVDDPLVGRFLRRVVHDEIVPSLDLSGIDAYAREVLDRFANPFIRHALFDITLQATMKMRVRVVPSVLGFADRTGRVPAALAFGFAAYLLFMRGDAPAARRRAGLPVPPDDRGEDLAARWAALADDSEAALRALAESVCADVSLWGVDLAAAVPGFAAAVGEQLVRVHHGGVPTALESFLAAEAVTT
jgi:tagaturonate reductase